MCLKCATSHRRIVGGKDATPNAYPWMTAIVIQKRSQNMICGGTLISHRFILTAAHCTQGANVNAIRVILGTYDLNSQNESNSVSLEVKRLVEHESFLNNHVNDIALVELDKNVEIPSICLPKSSIIKLEGKTATVLGWGKVSFNGPLAQILQEVTVKIFINKKCYKYYRKYTNYTVSKKDICAGSKGRDSCLGDSGGPLFFKDHSTGSYVQIGIVKFGVDCGFIPGMYTRIDKYLRWIRANVKDLKKC
ncbi:Venom serine protease 34 [Armadillidium nasatum]|uniref:limulus clotting factor C n=1 Tax=Armadillidium nasatum TaxID=96803 RepID=A0A5N5SZA6_9CRUS|nr:Venom serine protease 34 [Armadillidium nasatum]